jgi:Leucine-rich repeat (LRR) protein
MTRALQFVRSTEQQQKLRSAPANIELAALDEALSDNPHIRALIISARPLEASFPPALGKLPSIQELCLIEMNLTAQSARLLAQNIPWKELTSLNLSSNPKLGPRGCKAFATHIKAATNLQVLDFSHTSMGYVGAQAIEFPAPCVSQFYASHNNMGHDGIWKLTQRLANLSHLTGLDLSYNKCLDDGCLELARHVLSPSLRSLNRELDTECCNYDVSKYTIFFLC